MCLAKQNVKHDLSLIVIEGRCVSAVATAGDYTTTAAAHSTAAATQSVGLITVLK